LLVAVRAIHHLPGHSPWHGPRHGRDTVGAPASRQRWLLRDYRPAARRKPRDTSLRVCLTHDGRPPPAKPVPPALASKTGPAVLPARCVRVPIWRRAGGS